MQELTEIKQRSRGIVDSTYYDAKAELLRNAVKGHCIICHAPLGKGRKKYCTQECFENWFKQFKPPFLWNEIRRRVFRRDHHTCVQCHKRKKDMEKIYGDYSVFATMIADHIIPIALGGEEFDEKNVQTLCHDCNKVKTKFDQQMIAKWRRKLKGLPDKPYVKPIEEIRAEMREFWKTLEK